MYISRFPTLLNHVHANVAGPFFRLFNVSHLNFPTVGNSPGNSQLWERSQELADTVYVKVIPAVNGVRATLLICRGGRQVLGLVGELGGTAANDGVDSLELGRGIPASARVIVRDAKLARSSCVLRASGEFHKRSRARLDGGAKLDVGSILTRKRVEIAAQRVDLHKRLNVEVVRDWRRQNHMRAGNVEKDGRSAKKRKQSG
jgi:hypothetical protein